MALTDAENAAISSLLTGGVEAPLEEQPGTEEKPVELALFGRAGSAASNFVQRMLFGDGLFKSREILEDLKAGRREKLNLADMFVDPDASAEESKTIPKFIRNLPENAAISSLLTGGVEAPLEEQPGTEEKPVELALFGRAGSAASNFVQRMLFGDGLFKSREILEDLKAGRREKLNLADMFVDPDASAEESKTIPKFIRNLPDGEKIEVNIAKELAAGDKTEIKPTDKEFKTFQKERLSDVQPIKGLLTDFRVQGSKGDEKIPNEQSVLNTIEAISKSQAGKITEAKRGEIENAELEKLSDLVGLSPNALKKRILNRRKGEAINVKGFGIAETMLASRTLLENEIRKLDELAEIAASGNDQSLIAFRQQFELVAQLQAQIKGSQTEIARALAQFRIPTRNEQFNRLRNQDARVLLDEFGGGDNLKIMAQRYLELDSDSAKAQWTIGS